MHLWFPYFYYDICVHSYSGCYKPISIWVRQNVKLAKAALRVGAGNMVNALLRKLVLLKVIFLLFKYILGSYL